MNELLYQNYHPQHAVKEPKIAGPAPPKQLNKEEKRLYLRLVDEEMGHLEQVFIPKKIAKNKILQWVGKS